MSAKPYGPPLSMQVKKLILLGLHLEAYAWPHASTLMHFSELEVIALLAVQICYPSSSL